MAAEVQKHTPREYMNAMPGQRFHMCGLIVRTQCTFLRA